MGDRLNKTVALSSLSAGERAVQASLEITGKSLDEWEKAWHTNALGYLRKKTLAKDRLMTDRQMDFFARRCNMTDGDVEAVEVSIVDVIASEDKYSVKYPSSFHNEANRCIRYRITQQFIDKHQTTYTL